jgi:hypothetical protein
MWEAMVAVGSDLKDGPEVVRKTLSRAAQSDASFEERFIGRIWVMVVMDYGMGMGIVYCEPRPVVEMCYRVV